MKNELYATHRDGSNLYLPKWDSKGEIVHTGLPTAAVSIDSEGKVFPEGSTWIKRPRSSGLQDGWRYADGTESKARKKRAPNASYLARLIQPHDLESR
jgi:hypothetical protein